MRRARCTLAFLSLWASAAFGQAACDRACLENLAEQYLEALAARAPSTLPLARAVKFTENGQRLHVGDGLWNTVTGRGRYALHIADAVAGQAVFLGTIQEAGKPTVLVLRLGVLDGAIAEIETVVIRDTAVAERLEAIGSPRRAWAAAVPENERLARADLVAIANSYFTAVERNDGKGDYRVAESCTRLENGMITAGDPAAVYGAGMLTGAAPEAAAPPAPPAPRYGCKAQFETGMFYYVTRVRDRRFVAVDPERGVVFAFAFFDNAAGDARKGTLTDGREVLSGPEIPWTWEIAEAFKIEKGLIGPVESVIHQVPYGMGSGWSSWEQALSSEPQIAGR